MKFDNDRDSFEKMLSQFGVDSIDNMKLELVFKEERFF